MPAARFFNIALVDRVYPVPDYFNASAKNTITFTLWEHLVAIARAMPGGFIPGPSWSSRAVHLQPHDVVIYFVLDPSQSVARKKLGIEPSVEATGGFTVFTPRGVVCEVYVEGQMPARRIANAAFHEMMHNKLKMGNEMHLRRFGGLGLAQSPSSESTLLTEPNIKLMAANLFRRVPQYIGAM